PVPSSTTAGLKSRIAAIDPVVSWSTRVAGKSSMTRSAAATMLLRKTRSTIVTDRASTARTNSSRSLRCSVSCMAGIGDGYCGAARREQPTKPMSTNAEQFVVRNRTTNGLAGRLVARPQGGRNSLRRNLRTAGDDGILPSLRQRDLRRLVVAPVEGG